MNNDMIYDIAEFDFNDIDEGGDDSHPLPGDDGYGIDGGADFDDDFVPDDFDEDFTDEEVEEDVQEEFSAGEFANNFDTLEDEFEFTIGGEKITKADIADVVRTRSEMKEAHEGLSSYVSNLSDVEMRIQTYLQASMTETETRLRQVESMLETPERMTPTEVQKALVAKRDLMARQGQLEKNASEIRAAEEERRMQLDLMKIRQTDAELKTKVPGYKGVNTMREVATWAQSQGISEDDLKNAMSPGLIKVLMDAKLYREKVTGKRAVADKARARVAPKAVSSKPKARTTSKSSSTRKAAYERAMSNGDTASAFNFLTE